MLTQRDLPPTVESWPEGLGVPPWEAGDELPVDDGLYACYYADGQLRCLAGVESSRLNCYLSLEAGVEHAYYSGVSEASYEFGPDHRVTTWSHFDDSPPKRTRQSFRNWLLKALREILEAYTSPPVLVPFPPSWTVESTESLSGPRLAGKGPCLMLQDGLIRRRHPWLCAYLGHPSDFPLEAIPQEVARALESPSPSWVPLAQGGLTQGPLDFDNLTWTVLLLVRDEDPYRVVLLGAFPCGDYEPTRAVLESMMRGARVLPGRAGYWLAHPPRESTWRNPRLWVYRPWQQNQQST